ncbi:aldehyde dehydrogenase family protein [Microbulbifer agarilyticus]|uniref:aldehyde dehydrogenase family protein n=1 Tax=Microbulbifer agarilyticus TaxID=260552 RepID=UPI001C977D32|nr:aldehyde dehydrogenase family protein [Microbulbifer agarilyticus]MBY6191520.1 aldehyde dehydrogenase family protein [Microbulbifer agarilyticus]MBY6212572.1 aldehyde dehydrogenase family protein [Microbulbifer agarilyticus]MCA0894187.1 aldehyde dehydrogenase family protein [Microbulbifer agarilyticus]
MHKLQCISPIDNRVYVERPLATEYEIQNALNSARSAQLAWRQVPVAERVELVRAAVANLQNQKSALAEEICWQMGRPIVYAGGEIDGLAERALYMADLAESGASPLQDISLPEKSGYTRFIRREPLGTSLVIAPWNYPYLTAINAVVPALLAGNSVILKHSAQTPLCAERLVDAFVEAGLPAGVFQYLHLGHRDAEQIIIRGSVEHVAFTGSVAGGAAVESAAAGRFLAVGLELGGKDPAYVRADADVEYAVDSVVDGAFFNSGQSCCGIERLYVHRSVYDEFVARAVQKINQYRLGRSDEPETTLGPLVRASAADFVRDQIDEAVAQGAHAHIDEGAFAMDCRGSAYMAPQLLSNVDHDMRVMNEESFGPVLGVVPVRDDEEALALMNDSEFGLTAAIYSADEPVALALGDRLRTGTVFLNRCDYLDPALAWTGVKNSGRGCTLSGIGFEHLTRPKSFNFKLPRG